MEITKEQLEKMGFKPSSMENNQAETYVSEDYTVWVYKAQTMDGWFLSVINNYGEPISEEPLAEKRTRISTGYVTEMEDIEKAKEFCGLK